MHISLRRAERFLSNRSLRRCCNYFCTVKRIVTVVMCDTGQSVLNHSRSL